MAKLAITPATSLVKGRISAPFWEGRKGRRNRVRFVRGIHNSYRPLKGDSRTRIDATIARIIARMNDAGIYTMFCCSGRKCDHEDTAGGSPYVSIFDSFPPSLIDALPHGVFLESNDLIRFWPCGEKELARRWKAFGVAVEQFAARKEYVG